MTHSSLANGVQITPDSSPRTSGIDRFIFHHAATSSLAAILSLFAPGGRTVSANYAMGNDGTLILAVDEDQRAWTSASSYWDSRAVTIEVANSVAGEPWPVSDASFDKLARLIADVSLRYGFPINDDTVLGHRELYERYGDSYATACPGDMYRRKSELLALANHYRSSGPASVGTKVPIQEDEMHYIQPGSGLLHLADEFGVDAISQFVDSKMGNAEVVDASNRTFGQYTDAYSGNGRLEAVGTTIARRRWDAKRKEIAAEVVVALEPLLKALASPEIPQEALDAAIGKALEGLSIDAVDYERIEGAIGRVDDEVIARLGERLGDQ